MTIAFMAALLTTIGALALRASHRSSSLEAAGRTHAIVMRELSRLSATPYGSLPAQAGCRVSQAEFPHTRCVTVTDLSPHVRRVTLVVTPTRAAGHADTVVLDRATAASSPFARR